MALLVVSDGNHRLRHRPSRGEAPRATGKPLCAIVLLTTEQGSFLLAFLLRLTFSISLLVLSSSILKNGFFSIGFSKLYIVSRRKLTGQVISHLHKILSSSQDDITITVNSSRIRLVWHSKNWQLYMIIIIGSLCLLGHLYFFLFSLINLKKCL